MIHRSEDDDDGSGLSSLLRFLGQSKPTHRNAAEFARSFSPFDFNLINSFFSSPDERVMAR
jgi:hypothetical protein